MGDPVTATVVTGVVNCLVTVVTAPLLDKLGRRVILITGTAMMTVAYGLLAVSQACNVRGGRSTQAMELWKGHFP